MMRSCLCRVSMPAFLLAAGIGAVGFAQTQAPVAPTAAMGGSPAASGTSGGSPSASGMLQGTTVLHSNTNLVLVDVVVVEKGRPIHALDRAKFHIFEDGHERAITSFDEHAGSDLAPAALKPAKLPPNTYSNFPTYPDTGVVNVLLLDALNTPIANQVEVRQQMVEYLAKIKPGTTLAIYTLASRLRQLQGFTTDTSRLVKAVQGAKAGAQKSMALQTPEDVAENDKLIDVMTASGAPEGVIAAMKQFMADTTAYQVDMRVRMTLDALNELARTLSGIPGRKNLIWFSGSFPIALDPDDTLSSPFEAMRNYSQEVEQTSELLSASRVAVYPVDARGLLTNPTFQASYKTSGDPAKGGNFMRDNDRFTQQTDNEQSTMKQIAEQTGGQEYINTNGLGGAVASAVEHGSDYYTVGYVPAANKLDGHFHKIQVKMDGSGYKLAYRRGYYAENGSKTSSHDPVKSNLIAQAAMYGAPQATQILFQVQLVPADDTQIKGVKLPDGPAGAMAGTLKGPIKRYLAVMQIDPKGIRFEEKPDGTHSAALELALIAYDEDGKTVNYFEGSFALNLKDAQYSRVMAGKIPAVFPLDFPVGKGSLRIVILDRAAGRVGSLEVRVSVTALKAGS
jgi:VWFA-related protein